MIGVTDTDVLIFGAGPGGCATALALRDAGIQHVSVIDKPVRTPFRIGESATPDIPLMLESLGVPMDMAASGHLASQGTLSVWGGDTPQFNDFLRRGRGSGWHLNRAAFDGGLRQAVIQAGATVLDDHRLENLVHDGRHWLAAFGSCGVIRARILVDAAGRRSPIATRMGAERRTLDSLVALAVIRPGWNGMGGMSVVESCRDGWWYAAPLPNGQTMVALMTDADLAAQDHLRGPDRFAAAFHATETLKTLAPAPDGQDAPLSFAAHGGCIGRAAGPGWIAVGDALIGFDPLTSSGIAGAISDAIAAAPVIRRWLDGHDPAVAVADYLRRANSTMTKYVREWRHHYGWERRWPQSPFWLRRHAPALG